MLVVARRKQLVFACVTFGMLWFGAVAYQLGDKFTGFFMLYLSCWGWIATVWDARLGVPDWPFSAVAMHRRPLRWGVWVVLLAPLVMAVTAIAWTLFWCVCAFFVMILATEARVNGRKAEAHEGLMHLGEVANELTFKTLMPLAMFGGAYLVLSV